MQTLPSYISMGKYKRARIRTEIVNSINNGEEFIANVTQLIQTTIRETMAQITNSRAHDITRR